MGVIATYRQYFNPIPKEILENQVTDKSLFELDFGEFNRQTTTDKAWSDLNTIISKEPLFEKNLDLVPILGRPISQNNPDSINRFLTSEDAVNICVDLEEINLDEENYLKHRMELLKSELIYSDVEKWSSYLHRNYLNLHNFFYDCAKDYEINGKEFWILISII